MTAMDQTAPSHTALDHPAPGATGQTTEQPFAEIYFDVQAQMDLTKHPGGLDATTELIELCAIDITKSVLDVGCGVGMTPVYLAKEIGCRVTGVDLRASMIARARERAQHAGVRSRVDLVVADARRLPFRDGAFQVVMAESVLALIAEQETVAAECVRTTEPGGFMGMVETNWRVSPPAGFLDRLSEGFGRMIYVRAPGEWQQLLEEAGLQHVVARNHAMSLLSEARGRFKRLGLRQILHAWRTLFSISWTEPKYRRFVKEAISEPRELLQYWGYGVYVGRKPARGTDSFSAP